MHVKKLLSWTIGLWAIGTLTASVPTSAQPIQSDVSGTNTFDYPTIGYDETQQLDPEIIQAAQRYSQQLDDAYAACQASLAEAEGPRRFALGPGDSEECISADCAALNELVSEVRTFLSRLDRAEAERLQLDPTYRIW